MYRNSLPDAVRKNHPLNNAADIIMSNVKLRSHLDTRRFFLRPRERAGGGVAAFVVRSLGSIEVPFR
jgi:hypothetical protein